MNDRRTTFEGSAPILNVADMSVSLRCYVDVLGFENADWGSDDFTQVKRDGAGIYLCRRDQSGSASRTSRRHAPEDYPWAYEMKVEDPDGHVLRFGSKPRADLPFAKQRYASPLASGAGGS